jgi:uncharacterized protein (DUF3084 family)
MGEHKKNTEEAYIERDEAMAELEGARQQIQAALDEKAKALVEIDDMKSALAKVMRNKGKLTLEVGLYKLNAVKTHSLKAPGFNPWSLLFEKLV